MSVFYPKCSFDRFGDDFCELLLSYLSFDDKFRFECLSKQCQRTVFQRQYDFKVYYLILFKVKKLQFNGSDQQICINEETIKTILNKLPNIKYIWFTHNSYYEHRLLYSVENYEQIIQLVIKHCKHVKTIDVNTLQTLDPELQQTLEENNVEVVGNKYWGLSGVTPIAAEPVLTVCPNINQLNFDDISLIYNNIVNQYMNCIKCIEINIYPIDYPLIDTLLARMPRLEGFEMTDSFGVESCIFESLAKLPQLKYLRLKLRSSYLLQPMPEFEAFASQCCRLESIDIYANDFNYVYQLFPSFKHFTHIKTFTFKAYDYRKNESESYLTFEKSFPNANQMTDLWLEINELNDNSFKDCHLFAPQLETIHIKTAREVLTDVTINYISRLKKLRSLRVSNGFVSDECVYNFVINCPTITFISIAGQSVDPQMYKQIHLLECNIRAVRLEEYSVDLLKRVSNSYAITSSDF